MYSYKTVYDRRAPMDGHTRVGHIQAYDVPLPAWPSTSVPSSSYPPPSFVGIPQMVPASHTLLSAQHMLPSSFFDCWSNGLELMNSIDSVCGFDSFKQFLKTMLFSLYECHQRTRGFLM